MLGTCSGLFKSPPICELFEFPAWKLRTVVRNDYIRYPIVCKGGFKLGDDFTTVASQSLPILSNSWQLEDSPFHQGWIDHRQSFARAFLRLDAVSVALWYCPFYVLGMNCNLQSDLLSVHSCLASTGCCTLFVCSIQFPRWLSWILLSISGLNCSGTVILWVLMRILSVSLKRHWNAKLIQFFPFLTDFYKAGHFLSGSSLPHLLHAFGSPLFVFGWWCFPFLSFGRNLPLGVAFLFM